MSGQALFDPSFSGRLCITLVHSLWQVALCAAVAWVLGLIWRRSVERSYAAHVAALLAGLVALPITYALVGGEGRIPVSRIEPLADSPSQAPLSLSAGYGGPQLPIETSERAARPPTTTPTSALISPAGATSSSTTPASPSTLWLQAAPWIAALYAAGVLVMLARLLRGVWHAHRLASAAQVIAEGVLAERLRSLAGRWSMRLVPALAQSGEIAVPRLVGLLKPMILLPVSAIAGLSTDELEWILAHELAHVRRHDMWVNLAQRAAEVLLFFNPGLWYLSRRISTLREYCCDELTCRAAVGADAGRRMCYATALLRIVELSLQGEHHRRCGRVLKGDELAALAAAGRSPSELRRRVAHLFGEPLREPLRLTRSGVITLAALVALLLVAPATRHTAAVSAPATGVGGTEATGSRQTPASTERASPPAATKPATTTQEIDPAEVRRKIAALALPDETAPYEEQAIHWLRRRAAQVAPQLIAGLNNANPQVAAQCLNLLREVPPSKDLTDALVAKASDANSPLRYEALRVLEKSAADPRVARLLDQASSEAPTSDETQARGESQRSSSEAESFPNAVTRARWASLAGRNDRAVELLRPLLDKSESVRWETVEGIRLLGEVDAPAGIALLEPIAAGDNWGLAIEAYQALAKIDPENHGLTEDQATLLRNWRSFKETREHFEKRTSELARLSAKEVRPLVLQMLGDTEHQGQRAALSILTAWKDKEALPEIRRLMRAERSYQREAAVLAYLSIDESQQAEQEVLTLLEQRDEFARDAVLRGVCRAGIPAARKLAILRAARTRLTEPHSLPSALRSIEEDEVLPVLLVPLMDEETSLRALAGYCGIAAADKDRRFAPQVRRALKLVASEPSIAAGGENTDAGTAEAGTAILAAAAVYNLRELATEIEGLLDSANPEIRLTAQAAGAKLGIERALTGLYHRLHAEVPYVRKQAADAMLWSIPVDENERAARESAVLSCLGTPSEDYAMRVLVTCGGKESVKALLPILNDPDAQRALYAAWVLAQMPDTEAAAKGLRRVAIFAMFQHQMYQQGAGIDFPIAPDLAFHQTTETLNPGAYDAGENPVQIPDELLAPFDWDDAEQQFAVRCYRLAELRGNPHGLNLHFLQPGHRGPKGMNQTHLPLLNAAAAEDTRIDRLMVQGKAVAHFSYRKLAAEAIASITGDKAAYIGLAGETLASDAFPQPYPNQDQLLAGFVLDRIAAAPLVQNPQNDREWQQIEAHKFLVRLLQDRFGPQVVNAIRNEAERRKIDVTHIVPPEQPAPR